VVSCVAGQPWMSYGSGNSLVPLRLVRSTLFGDKARLRFFELFLFKPTFPNT
jgi:hypothetical protein